jgi:NTE family protein
MINYVLICLSFIILTAQNQPDKVKLALSGGGARGFAHVGVLKALEEFGIEVEEIAGVSAGALVGGLYASGYTIDEIEVLLKELISTEEIFSNYSRQDIPIERKFETFPNFIDIGINNNGPVFPSSLTGDSRLNYYLLRFFSEADLAAKHDFKNLSIPLTIIAADVFAEEAVRFSEGDLSRIVRASISIPTALPPVEIDNRFLVDGGIYNNLPTDMYSDSDYVVAANVASETFKSKEEINSVFDMMGHMINILSSKSDSLSILNWDIFIEPDLKGYTATNWFDYDSLVLLGYQAAVKTFESKGFKRKPYKKRVSSRPVRFENYKVGNLELTGSYRLTKEHIMKKFLCDQNMSLKI